MKDVKAQKIILSDGTEVPYGLLVWSTGVAPSPIIQSMDLPKAPGGRLVFPLNIVAFTSKLPHFSIAYYLKANSESSFFTGLVLMNGFVFLQYRMCFP